MNAIFKHSVLFFSPTVTGCNISQDLINVPVLFPIFSLLKQKRRRA